MTGAWGVISDAALTYPQTVLLVLLLVFRSDVCLATFACSALHWAAMLWACTLCLAPQKCSSTFDCHRAQPVRLHMQLFYQVCLATLICPMQCQLPGCQCISAARCSHMSDNTCVSAEYTTTESQCIKVNSTKGMSALEGTSSSYRASIPGACLRLVTRWVLMEFWVRFLSCWDWKSTILVASTDRSVSVSAFATCKYCLVSANLHFAIQQVQTVHLFCSLPNHTGWHGIQFLYVIIPVQWTLLRSYLACQYHDALQAGASKT